MTSDLRGFQNDSTELAEILAGLCRLGIQPLIPVKLPACDNVFHPLKATIQVAVSPFQPIGRPFPGIDIAVIKLLFLIGPDGQNRFWLHHQRCNEVDSRDGPEARKQQAYQRDGPDPEDGKVKIFGKPSANTQYVAVTGAVQPAP